MNSANKSYEIKGVLGIYALEQSTKILTLTRMPIRIQFSQAGVINLITWFVDLFCDFANKLNKKARANTKNNRNIFTLSALRYELVDESVNIKKGTLWFSVLQCWQLFRSFFRFFALKIFSFSVLVSIGLRFFLFWNLVLKLLKKNLRFFGFGICCLVSVREFSFSARAITFDVNLFLRCNLRDLRLQNMAENEVNEFDRKEGQEVIVDCVENCAV